MSAARPGRRRPVAGVDRPQGYLAIARVVGAHGVQGELRCELMTDFPERFARTKRVYAGEEHVEIALERARLDRGRVLLKVLGVDSRTAAELFIGLTLYVPESEAVPLPKGSYFWHEIIGLHVQTIDGVPLGTIVDIVQTGSNDVYVVEGETGEILLPATPDVVQSVDLDQGVMAIQIIEGLI